MKKLVTILFASISISLSAQNLDTVFVRNLTMQAQDWAWLVGKHEVTKDSVSLYGYRKIRGVVQSNIPQNWTVNVTVDSLPGAVVVGFYNLVKTAASGEIASRYTAITNAISSKQNIAYWVGYLDASISNDFIRFRNLGKNRLIDQ